MKERRAADHCGGGPKEVPVGVHRGGGSTVPEQPACAQGVPNGRPAA